MARIEVKVPGARYEVIVEAGALSRAGRELKDVVDGRRCAVITNAVVWKHWGAALAKSLAPAKLEIFRAPAGEEHKTLDTVETICEWMVRAGMDRSSLVIAFGGGIIGDVGGFVAASYLRGVDYVQVPTTLLAQIDSSVGGKTGVNLAAGKNLVGAFYHPRRVLADPEVLRTLPPRELRAGLYEAIKTGIIRSKPLFDDIEKHLDALLACDAKALGRVVEQCVEIKAWVVGKDERESGLRRILNFGHTVGHALEAETEYRHYLHGEAVAWGMRAATAIAEGRGMLRAGDAARIHGLVRLAGPLPPLVRITPARLRARLMADKKTRGGVVHFVLPTGIGKVEIVRDVALEEVVAALQALRSQQ